MNMVEAVVSLPKSKTRKLLIEQNVGEGEDLISKLHDNILLHILSFLPIKDVLRTSVLSTRWKYLWISISDIDFDETSHTLPLGMRTSILDSLDKVLLLHDHSCIRKFRFRCSMDVNASRVSSWVYAAISHKVQELDLALPVLALFELPDSLFTSDTLSIFKLKMDSSFKVPSFTNFSNLKILYLKKVTFRDNQSPEHLFSGCPVLQKLAFYRCVWKDTKRITISIPTLRALSIYDPRSLDYLRDCLIRICAENLISLKCRSCLAIGLSLSNLSSLKEAYINEAAFKHPKKEFAQRATKLIGGIRNVKSLTLSNNTLQCLSYQENLQACPTFHRLSRLKVISGLCDYKNDQVLMYFLQKSPNVKSLEIPKVFHVDNIWLLKIGPQCFKSCLKTISISYFEGYVTEVLFLKSLLEHANLLERVTIFCSDDLAQDMKQQMEINRELQTIRSCVIEFCKHSS